MVRIYFDTPTFDRITKDERAKFEVMLSTVGRFRGNYRIDQWLGVRSPYVLSNVLIPGGTLGLLTGFSLISGVEIVYFVFKFIIGLVWRENLKD